MVQRRFNLLLALIAAVSSARGQEQPAPPAADDSNLGVFVRDSAVAADKLALADRMEKSREWDTSAELYQEVLDGFADRVVPIHFDAAGHPDRYGGVTSVIQDRIAAWPDAGREVYVARYGQPAVKLLEAADPNDRAALSKIADRYFVTDAGRDATLRLIELHFDAGEFAACAALADRLLDHHPALADADRPLLLLRSSVAWSLARELERAKQRADQLATRYADARAMLGGEDQSLSAVAAAELARPRDANTVGESLAHADAWPMPFGSNDHAAAPAEPDAPARGQPPREWGKLLSFPLTDAKLEAGVGAAELATFRTLIKRQRDLGAVTGILPAIDGSQLFFQDNARLYARDLTTGNALPGWLASYPKEAGAFTADTAPLPSGTQMTVTLTDGCVLAILGQNDASRSVNMGGMPQTPGTGARLVCLDRVSGKVIWFKRMSDAADALATQAAAAPTKPADAATVVDAAPKSPPPNPPAGARGPTKRNAARIVAPNAVPGGAASPDRGGDESLRRTEPRGSVLVVGDGVYVVARGGEAGAFEDCYLVSFALADGEFRWARHLASGNASRMNLNGYPQPDAPDSHLAAADGRIFVCTDMGAIAAVDSADGALVWLSLYPRPRGSQQALMNANMNNAASIRPAFEGNPVILRDGKVITMPADAEQLFVHDAATGKELARVSTKWKIDQNYELMDNARATGAGVETEDYNVLAGITGDTLVITSPRSLALLNWAKLRAADSGDGIAPHDVMAFHRVIRGPGFEDVAIRGRSFVTQRSVYIPTAWKLMRYDLASHAVLENYPAEDSLENRPEEAPGNLTVINGNLVVASPDRVSVYAGLDLVRSRLDAAIADSPDAITPRIRYAQTMANAGHDDEAMKWIDDAAKRVIEAQPARAADDADRNAVFDATSNLARDLDRPGHKPDPPFQAKLLTQLARLAATPTQQVVSHLLQGGLAAKAKDLPTAVAAYQALLDEPAWGSVYAKVGGDSMLISAVAADALKTLLSDPRGREAYAAIEARAAAALETAKANNDAAALFAVAERYPNAHAAVDAVRAASATLTGPSSGAATVNLAALRKLADRVNDAPERAALNEAMLRGYLAAGDLSAALGRARRIAWIDASRPVAPLPASGTNTFDASTAGALVDQLQQAVFARDEARLPDLKANFEGDSFDVAGAVVVKDTMSLLPPADLTHSRPDRIIGIARDRSLKIFEPGGSTPLKSIKVPSVTDRTNTTWLAGDRLLLQQPSRVACVDARRAELAWSFDPAVKNLDTAIANAWRSTGATIDDPELLALAPRPAAAPVIAAALTPQEQQLQQAAQQGGDPVAAMRQIRMAQANAIRPRVVRVVNGAVVNGQGFNGQMNDGSWEADPHAEDDSKESAVFAKPAADGAIIAVASSRGRVVALDAASGTVKWRVTLGDRSPAVFSVVNDVIVFVTTDESASRVIALDANTGGELLRRTYTGSSNSRVCNAAVSDEGWLAIVTGDGVQLFDLLGGEREPLANITVNSESGAPPFVQSRAPDHLAFCAGRLLILADTAQPSTSVRSFDLPTLIATHTVDSKTKQSIERRYLPRFAKDQRTNTEQISIAVHNDRLYVMTGLFMTSYPALGEDPANSTWSRALPDQPSALSLQSPLLVKDGVLLIGWPKDFIGMTAPAARAELYSRQTYDGKHESGMLVEDAELTRRGGKIYDKFQPVNGGIYYTTTDGSLVFVPGKPKPADAK